MKPTPSVAVAPPPAQRASSRAINQREPEVIVEKRSAPRRQASLMPSIGGVRLSPYGADATLINISASGVLVECNSRLKPGSEVTVVFDSGCSPSSIEGWVARSSVAGIDPDGALRYQLGIAFKNPVRLDDAPATTLEQPETPLPQPITAPVPVVLRNRW